MIDPSATSGSMGTSTSSWPSIKSLFTAASRWFCSLSSRNFSFVALSKSVFCSSLSSSAIRLLYPAIEFEELSSG